MRDHSGNHAPVDRLLRAERAAGEHQVAGAHGPDQAGQHLAVVGVGDTAVQLRHAERGAVAHHGHVTADRDLQSAALAQPVDRAHHRFDRLAQGFERGDVHRQGRAETHPVVDAVAAPEVAAGREHVSRPCDEQAGQIGVRLDVGDGVADAEVHGRRHRIASLGPVQGDHAERATPLEPQVGGAKPVAVGW